MSAAASANSFGFAAAVASMKRACAAGSSGYSDDARVTSDSSPLVPRVRARGFGAAFACAGGAVRGVRAGARAAGGGAAAATAAAGRRAPGAKGISSVYSRRRRASHTFSIASFSTGSLTRAASRTTRRASAPLPLTAIRPWRKAGNSPPERGTTRKHSASAGFPSGRRISARKLSPIAESAATSPSATAAAGGAVPSEARAIATAIASGMLLLFIFRASGGGSNDCRVLADSP